MQYDNVHIKQALFLAILKNQRIQRANIDILTNEKDAVRCIVKGAFYAESVSMLFCLYL